MKTGETQDIELVNTFTPKNVGDPAVVVADFPQIVSFVYYCENSVKTIVGYFALDINNPNLDQSITWTALTATYTGTNEITLDMQLASTSTIDLLALCDRVDMKIESSFVDSLGDVSTTENEIKLEIMKQSIGEGLF